MLKPNPSKNKSAVRSPVFNNETYSDELEIVQIFNEPFQLWQKKMNDSTSAVTTGYNLASELSGIPSQEPFRFASLSPIVIENAIKSLKIKRNNIDTYSVETLKIIEFLVFPLLVHIFNLFFKPAKKNLKLL